MTCLLALILFSAGPDESPETPNPIVAYLTLIGIQHPCADYGGLLSEGPFEQVLWLQRRTLSEDVFEDWQVSFIQFICRDGRAYRAKAYTSIQLTWENPEASPGQRFTKEISRNHIKLIVELRSRVVCGDEVPADPPKVEVPVERITAAPLRRPGRLPERTAPKPAPVVGSEWAVDERRRMELAVWDQVKDLTGTGAVQNG